jgi:hypothetical protein
VIEVALTCDGKGCGVRYIVAVERLALNDSPVIDLIDLSAHTPTSVMLEMLLSLPEGFRAEGKFPELRVYCPEHAALRAADADVPAVPFEPPCD